LRARTSRSASSTPAVGDGEPEGGDVAAAQLGVAQPHVGALGAREARFHDGALDRRERDVGTAL
jgi:hypothetical protein